MEMNELKTKHFHLHYPVTVSDRMAKKVSGSLEHSYGRITGDIGGPALPVINVYIHPNKESLKKAVGFYAQGAIVGTGQIHLVKLKGISQLLISYEKLALHEFSHCATLNLLINNDLSSGKVASLDEWTATYDSPDGPGFYHIYPRWLWESVACYEARQLNIMTLFISIVNGFPSLSVINSHGSKVYFMGYTVADFIVSRWGRGALNSLIIERGNLPDVLDISEAQFSIAYRRFVYKKYFGWYYRFLQLSSGLRSINLL
jgi:hypothetical protein